MAKILGLDLGTNSIGWAVVDSETNVVDKTGVRIFPEGVNIDATKKTESSKNQTRRDARGARKNNYRFKLRRKILLTILAKIGLMPDDKFYTNTTNNNFDSNNQKILRNHTFELFQLRKDALDKQIRKEDIGRLFIQINNHRGFKSNKKEQASLQKEEKKKDEPGKVQGRIDKLEKKNKRM